MTVADENQDDPAPPEAPPPIETPGPSVTPPRQPESETAGESDELPSTEVREDPGEDRTTR